MPRESRRLHRGDIMSPEKRSAVMARIRGSGTKPELAVQQMLLQLGVEFETHARDLPGRPDFVLRSAKVAILVDGDFWHGWRFEQWRLKLSEHWERKIASNRRRDTRNRRLLRDAGWTVVRLWEHQVREAPARCRRRIIRALGALPGDRSPGT
jgi:DNA mismatch endonuclease (patch repair protein)